MVPGTMVPGMIRTGAGILAFPPPDFSLVLEKKNQEKRKNNEYFLKPGSLTEGKKSGTLT